ncbi:MAG: hypothetical protein ACREO7_10140 [Pseudoxanthomonas sp.]
MKKAEATMAIEDMAMDLGLIESDVIAFLRTLSPPITQDFRGRPSVPIRYISIVGRGAFYEKALRRALVSDDFGKRNVVGDPAHQIDRLLDRYCLLVDELEAIHRRYLDRANAAGSESSGMAAYLLLSRSIAILRATNESLRQGHWYSGSSLRDIDETLDVALYLVISAGTEKGQVAIFKWFRENLSPPHAECRSEIARWCASLSDRVSGDQHLSLMKELYRKKSKWTHPTYLAIRETATFDLLNESPKLSAVNYGPCVHQNKLLELVDFFRSSIWSCFQVHSLCFNLAFPISVEEKQLFLKYDQMFLQWQSAGVDPMGLSS